MPAPQPCPARASAQGAHGEVRNQESQNSHLTLLANPLPYGCGSIEYNICRFVRSDPAGDDRTALTWSCLCAWMGVVGGSLIPGSRFSQYAMSVSKALWSRIN